MDEMLYTAVRYRWVGETSAAPNNYDQALNASHLMGMLDQRMDGKITKDELTGPVGSGLLEHFEQIDYKKQGYISPEEWATVQSMMGHRHHGGGPALGPNGPTDASRAGLGANRGDHDGQACTRRLRRRARPRQDAARPGPDKAHGGRRARSPPEGNSSSGRCRFCRPSGERAVARPC